MKRSGIGFVIAGALVLIVLVILLVLWGSQPGPRDPRDVSVSPSTGSQSVPVPTGDGASDPPEPPDPPEETPPIEEALAVLARHTRQTYVRCALPASVRPGAHSDEPRVEEVHDGVLYMLLDEDSVEYGEVWISAPPAEPKPASEPDPDELDRVRARVADGEITAEEGNRRIMALTQEAFSAASAWESEGFLPIAMAAVGPFRPGASTSCDVHDEQVEVTIVATYPDGTPPPQALASASWGGNTSITDERGEASVVVWKGLSVTVDAREWSSRLGAITEPAYGFASLDAPQGGERVPITLAATTTEGRILSDEEVAERHEAEADVGLDLSDALELALDDPSLSSEAREQIARWSTRLQEDADESLERAAAALQGNELGVP